VPDLRQRIRSLHARLFPPLEPRQPRPVVRLTRRNRCVLLVLLSGAPGLYGYKMCQLAQVGSGTLYPLLERLERAGWVTAANAAAPIPGTDLRRRMYWLTPTGRTEAFRLLGLEAPE
jgi:PadR family transcriptional regulator, regulatory protein PadR